MEIVETGEVVSNAKFELPGAGCTDQALSVAEELLGTHLVCPLGGKYELIESSSGRPVWHSTAWATPNADNVPQDYRAPLLQWFRGLELNLTKTGDQVSVRSRIDLRR